MRVVAALVVVCVGLSTACQGVEAETARWNALRDIHGRLIAEARLLEKALSKRVAGLPVSAPEPRRDLDDASRAYTQAIDAWDDTLRAATTRLERLLADNDGLGAVRALREEQDRLELARQAAADAHIVAQRALEVVVSEVAEARAKARGVAEARAAFERLMERTLRHGGDLPMPVVFSGGSVDVEASTAPLQDLFALLVTCKELQVELIGAGRTASIGKARAEALQGLMERRGIPKPRFKGSSGQEGDGVTIRVVKPCVVVEAPHED